MVTINALPSPIEPMLAKVAEVLPEGDDFLFEPKWDGFRAIVFRHGDAALIQSRDGKALNRYFPELERVLIDALPRGCVLDGEIVVVVGTGLDFDALQHRIHPAPSRIARLAKETPARFVAFDLLSAGGKSTMALPQSERRVRLERLLGQVKPPIHLTPMTRDRSQAQDWLQRFQGAGLDGVMAKPAAALYQPGKRSMFKIKHIRTADCVVAGFRWYKDFTEGVVGSLLLGLYDDAGKLQHVGVTSSFTMQMRKQLAEELAPLRTDAKAEHPWCDSTQASTGHADREPGGATGDDGEAHRSPVARKGWSDGKSLSWEPLRAERVVEVAYDHLQGDRFRDAATFMRWRDDKPAQDCRYDQFEMATAVELAQVFAAKAKWKA